MTMFPGFDDFFRALWPYDPFPWQSMLAERVASGTWPKVLDLPTAAGKTACIDAAIYALAAQAEKSVGERTAPRRIWFVVDRRIVVDEAFDRASTIAQRLAAATDGPLQAVADRLFQISGIDRQRGGKPLAVARLRGGILRDDNWARLPSQPAVITSTVDQLGSRLLFRGYGWSKLAAPIFAGLAAHDSLILVDEAHCSVPFLQTLQSIEIYRGEKWAESPIRTPFAFAMLSATPPPELPPEDLFPAVAQRAAALNHCVLQKRLAARKPARLEPPLTSKANAPDALVGRAADQALRYANEGKRRVAVIVNRVRTAKEIAKVLCEKSTETDIVLLTGRLRPYERDRLVERWKPFLRAARPEHAERPIILVSTQCIEVGADFSFDALVTEAASLDALRQRFGRLNRMGDPGAAPATVLIREADTKPDRNDPIYGKTVAETWRLLSELADTQKERKKERKEIDFGFGALAEGLADVEPEKLGSCLAPHPNAPFLLPAYLDLLCQTAPVPRPEPDIRLFLHGIDRGIPEVRLVFRADLPPENPDSWAEIVSLCPPSSGELLSAPLHAIRAWLANAGGDDDGLSDVESSSIEEDAGQSPRICPVLLWRGRDRSRVRRCAAALKPDDILVVPSGYGFPKIGQSVPAEALGTDRLDLWEPARSVSGKPKALRLNRAVLQPWIECPAVAELVSRAEDAASEAEDIQSAVGAVLAYTPAAEDEPPAPPEWLTELLRSVRNGRIESHPVSGLVLFERASKWRTAEPDLFADDDDLLSASGVPMSLADHSVRVEWAVEQIAKRCLPDGFVAPLQRAAYWHDVGKLDERFQVLLYEGDEVSAAAGEPRAKSPELPASPARRRAIREASGLPPGFRHEMLSYQLAERYAGLPASDTLAELILHLIASHHGHARPFAPVVQDENAPAVAGCHDGIGIKLGATERAMIPAPHTLRSGIPDRFWRLTRRYGWWGLAYLEAVLRLADWYGSLPVEEVRIERSPKLPLPVSGTKAHADERKIVLTGIDGTNPLGFLAAVGALLAIHQRLPNRARLSWKRTVTWQPVLTVPSVLASECVLSARIVEALQDRPYNNPARKHQAECWDRLIEAKRALAKKESEIEGRQREYKKQKRGKEEIKNGLTPLRKNLENLKQERESRLYEWAAAVRPELVIRDLPKCTASEWKEYAARSIKDYESCGSDTLAFLAAFASDACMEYNGQQKTWQLDLSPFCFVRGSGHQFFMASVRELMRKATAERVSSVLFDTWTYTDEGLSLRWDPAEDRRYALLDRDPTASGNKPHTVWMANLLAYRSLALFASAPTPVGLRTTGWSMAALTWPLWETPLPPDTIRSLLQLDELTAKQPNRAVLRTRGVAAAYRAQRIKVGSGANFKVNFSPARAIS
jgi:CRISPR-associated endonuclease/helicase Cas3